MSRYIDIETIKPRQYENSEVELGILAYDYDEVDAMPFLDIVRCSECEYATKRLNDDYLCTHHGKDWNYYNHFCSYGKRREIANDGKEIHHL